MCIRNRAQSSVFTSTFKRANPLRASSTETTNTRGQEKLSLVCPPQSFSAVGGINKIFKKNCGGHICNNGACIFYMELDGQGRHLALHFFFILYCFVCVLHYFLNGSSAGAQKA